MMEAEIEIYEVFLSTVGIIEFTNSKNQLDPPAKVFGCVFGQVF